MKKHAIALALLLAGSAGAAQPELYIRGGFNGWGLDHALLEAEKGVYEVQVMLSPGNHPFKVGDKGWTTEWVIDPAASMTVAPGTSYQMATRTGPEDYLFVRQTAPYRFRLDLGNPAAPVLRVTKLELPAVALVDAHKGHAAQAALHFATFDGKQETVRFSSPDAAAPLRSYAQSTTLQLRDPGPQHVLYQEAAGLPAVRSGSLAFDALFALATTEMQQNSVAQIKDGNYNGGAPIACDCFETGEKWHYVWTRDLSYAANLGLAMLDPQRVRNSLDFKLSAFRDGVATAPHVAGGLQIIQDTGSGGSWPVSTDRVSWAFGAEKALQSLPPAERKVFAARALTALSNTIDNDRVAAFDKASGLYTGEQSFLDWRDQSYAAWIVTDLASMATSKALSTNVGHYKALTLAASLAREHGDKARAERYVQWASDLKQAINKHLWLDDAGMFSSLTAGHFDGAPMYKFDWLGQALAVVTGVADGARARRIMASYPHGPMGAPVIYPQQPDMPVYHNRAMWPFVTAYGLKAAARTGNVAVADAAYDTLLRGAAVNLSNMENLEWLSGQPLLLDEKNPALIGPVINSKRQLWSVGAYLGMVIENVFGVSTTNKGIALRPFITAKLRREAFGQANEITLHRLRLQGKTLTVRVRLPKAVNGDGFYGVETITLNGVRTGADIAWDGLAPDSVIEIGLGKLRRGERAITRVTADPYAEASSVFGPREPAIAQLARKADGKIALAIAPPKGELAVYNIYRNGKLAASGLKGSEWIDAKGSDAACYAVEAQFPGSGNRSHHSMPRCLDAGISAALAEAVDIAAAGTYQVQVRYHNRANEINLGISGGVKWLTVRDGTGRTVAEGVVQMPHGREPGYSSPLAARLAAGRYSFVLGDFYNMSYLQANSTFSAAGGTAGPSNKVDLLGLRLLRVDSN